MSWFSLGGTDVGRLTIVMDLPLDTGRGKAAATWLQSADVPLMSSAQVLVAAVVLTYCRTLYVTNPANRPDLFSRVRDGAIRLNETGVFSLEEWRLDIGDQHFWIWPWEVDPEGMTVRGKAYVATLKATKHGTLFLHLKVPLLLDRVLAPSAALIALHRVSESLTVMDRVRLASTVLAVNEFYGDADAANVIGADTKAFAAALPHLLAEYSA